ncbi:uncharacterized protein KGF55_004042 [Candida pseudojiufengensis]|uniref:uncharacterized protein n=1 Tax=Candida pseudojiufengensis TaxID=497109 RepID=UPI0022245C3D|nr:uncharacterized protein KGF55_004042 [Candida pseudojiufengensis]KAI5961419.1 hypothetical protein KGF55_004042 [Candida pseudojiufengensis]
MKCAQFRNMLQAGLYLLLFISYGIIKVVFYKSELKTKMNVLRELNIYIINIRLRIKNQGYTQNAQDANLNQSPDLASNTTIVSSTDDVSQNSESNNVDTTAVAIIHFLWSFFKRNFETETLISESSNGTYTDDYQVDYIQNDFSNLAKQYRVARIILVMLLSILIVPLTLIIWSCIGLKFGDCID